MQIGDRVKFIVMDLRDHDYRYAYGVVTKMTPHTATVADERFSIPYRFTKTPNGWVRNVKGVGFNSRLVIKDNEE